MNVAAKHMKNFLPRKLVNEASIKSFIYRRMAKEL
jgi:hypothetical protein